MVSIQRARHILFLRTDRLGETLLNLPAIAALKQFLPNASLALLVHPDLQVLMSSFPIIDHVIPYPQDAHRAWWIRAYQVGCLLRSHRFDIAVVSNPMKELHLAARLAGIPVRVGYNRKWGWLLTHRLEDRKALGERHEAEYNLDLVRRLGFQTSTPQWPVPHLEREQLEVLQLLEQQGIQQSEPFIAVHPWTSNPLKEWPATRFAALIQQVGERVPLSVVVIGGPEHRHQADAIIPPALPVVNLVGRLTLNQLAALLARARLLVSNDSGPVHLAVAVKTKTLVLFGASSPATGPRRWGPWGEGHAVIWKASMEAITVEEVFEALRQMLETKQ
ncbi:MAG: glycosyltransferase family 9 protein [Candidatus Omnitrophica bacterium]|nr:glycosyltransferase family 9 protein [Candidatus Omnitrophota bacterium]MBI3082937.1 glycosyltransferase family 9 protein [Candidatus Omnitrophota bacterium]